MTKDAPTSKAIGFARSLSQRSGWPIPPTAMEDKAVCNQFISDATREMEIRAMPNSTKKHIRRIEAGILIQDARPDWDADWDDNGTEEAPIRR